MMRTKYLQILLRLWCGGRHSIPGVQQLSYNGLPRHATGSKVHRYIRGSEP